MAPIGFSSSLTNGGGGSGLQNNYLDLKQYKSNNLFSAKRNTETVNHLSSQMEDLLLINAQIDEEEKENKHENNFESSSPYLQAEDINHLRMQLGRQKSSQNRANLMNQKILFQAQNGKKQGSFRRKIEKRDSGLNSPKKIDFASLNTLSNLEN